MSRFFKWYNHVFAFRKRRLIIIGFNANNSKCSESRCHIEYCVLRIYKIFKEKARANSAGFF